MKEKIVSITINYDENTDTITPSIRPMKVTANNNVPVPDRLTWVVTNTSKKPVYVRIEGARPLRKQDELHCFMKANKEVCDFGARVKRLYKKGTYPYRVVVLSNTKVKKGDKRGPDIEII